MISRLPSLCRPWKATALFSDHGTMSMRHVLSCDTPDGSSRTKMAVAVSLRDSLPSNSWNHLPSSAQVLVLSCVSVLAVTTPLVSAAVHSDQRISQATKVLLPTPLPLTLACRIACSGVNNPFATLFRNSCCQRSKVRSANAEPG